jgi:DNA uptake protein ComE-like DNA-binding protein
LTPELFALTLWASEIFPSSSTDRGFRVVEEAPMSNKVRVNLANPAELLELPGIGPEQVRAIITFRAEHGPIQDASQLAKILGTPIAPATWERVEFDPSESTAPEAPGA